MKKALLMSLLALMLAALPAQAEVRWLGKAEGEKIFGGWMKDVTGPPGKGYWAGEIVEVEIDATDTGFTLTGRTKIKITWVTDRTSYCCHEVYIIHANECEDFTHRSLMLRECD